MRALRLHPAVWLVIGLATVASCATSTDDDDDGGNVIETGTEDDSGTTTDSGDLGDGGSTTATYSEWLSAYCDAAGGCLEAWDNKVDCVEDVQDEYDDTYGYCEFNPGVARDCINALEDGGECADQLEALEGTCDPSRIFSCD